MADSIATAKLMAHGALAFFLNAYVSYFLLFVFVRVAAARRFVASH